MYTWFHSAIWLVPPDQGNGSQQLFPRVLPGSLLPPRFWGESLGTRLHVGVGQFVMLHTAMLRVCSLLATQGHVTKLRNLIGQKSCDYSIYPRVVYILEWRHLYSGVSCTEYPPNSEHMFLPEWYMKKLPPPTDRGSSFIFLHNIYTTFELFYITFELFKLCWVLTFLHIHTTSQWLRIFFLFFLTYLRIPFSVNCFFKLWWYTAQSHPLTLMQSHSQDTLILFQSHSQDTLILF